MTDERATLLLVDDEESLLRSLAANLRRSYKIETATSGSEGLAKLAASDIALVISDMRMPGMNGAEFLARAQRAHERTVRILLTGQSDLESAIRAINEGRIFRFLTKPVSPAVLTATIEEGLRVRALEDAERELLEKTLTSSIEVLTDVLAMVHPECFSRATRLRAIVAQLCKQLRVEADWQVPIAALLSQLGFVALDPATVERLSSNAEPSDEDRAEYAKQSKVAAKLVAAIPRLETVARIIEDHGDCTAAQPGTRATRIHVGAHILGAALDFDRKSSRLGATRAIQAMRSVGAATPGILDALEQVDLPWFKAKVEELTLGELRAGMVLREEVRTGGGTLLAASGTSLTEVLLTRIRNFARNDGVVEPIVVETAEA